MKRKMLKKILNGLFKLGVIIVAIIALVKFACAELIVDKMHYGFTLVCTCILIQYLDDDNNNSINNLSTS